MNQTQCIRCPNCGAQAIRNYVTNDATIPISLNQVVSRTECPACDYLMVVCPQSGHVVEAQAPGLSPVSVLNPSSCSKHTALELPHYFQFPIAC